ncbi:MAG: TonB-dependent receptor [Chlorobi bacterium]|nr:TonB-dependent receptor [Chlorobiota bacterium]
MKKLLRNFMMVTAFALFTQVIWGQSGITGVVKDAEMNEDMIGATVIVEGTTNGTATDTDGKFKLDIDPGPYVIEVTYVGYVTQKVEVTVAEGEYYNMGTIKLASEDIVLGGILIVADRATERQTPVAFSNVEKKQIEEQLGSRDIPMVMNVTPSVYATQQGGGSGDARINVRGFNQSNVAIMINGVPVNDMENGWVYWSNWDGLGDATNSIQMQRGLSAVNLATPSIGGTMNIITNPAEQKGGFSYKQEFGSGRYIKSSLFGHTGLVDGKWAISAGGVRKVGEGVIDKTWTDAWAYYFGAAYNINSKNRLELYATGAPQRHGQNLYKQNIAAYGHDFAKSIDGYDPNALAAFPESQSGRLYNENWGQVSNKYVGKQYWNSSSKDRYNQQYINERENFYHKPLINLNWYSEFSDNVSLFTTAYYSGGKGGGTGTYGKIAWDYSGPSRMADWDGTIEDNASEEWSYKEKIGDSTAYHTQPVKSNQATGLLRNSVNNQWTLGLISKLKWKVSEKVNVSFGIDGRSANIEHYREVRDLLGGAYFSTRDANGDKLIKEIKNGSTRYYFPESEFWTSDDYQRTLGDKIDYYFTNTVNWMGGYGQIEYKTGYLSLYGMAGYSTIKYGYTNHFKKAEGSDAELTTKTKAIGGYQVKGGANYNLSETVNIFVNGGYVSKVPIFDAVINDRDGTTATDPKNEKFTSVEMGLQYKTINNKFNINGNFYYTMWQDRSRSIGIRLEDGNEGFVFLTGMDQSHMGFELEGAWQPVQALRFDFGGSIANWEHTNDVSGVYKDYQSGGAEEIPYTYYVKGLKIGDAPQTQMALGLSVYPARQFRVQLIGRYYANHYADWDPFSRTEEGDTKQSWKTPSYTVFDLHADYTLPLQSDVDINIFLHVFNLFDEMYIQDATDNSAYNSYQENRSIVNPHSADAAEVFLGMPQVFNFGFKINY